VANIVFDATELVAEFRGESLRPLGGTGSVPQTIVFLYKEIWDIPYCARNIGKTVIFHGINIL
jgi:hypothetical protein